MYSVKEIFKLYLINAKWVWATLLLDQTNFGGATYFGKPNFVLNSWQNKLQHKANKTEDEVKWLTYLNANKGEWYPESYKSLSSEPFELMIFLPRILLEPIIRTIIDIKTRKPSTLDAREKLGIKLKNLLEQNPSQFDIFIEGMIADPLRNNTAKGGNSIFHNIQFYQSINSKTLIADLYLAKFKEDHYPAIINCPIEDNDYLNTQQTIRRQQQLEAIQNYLNTSENNGTKLMQYMAVNLTDQFTNINTRESTLKTRARLELNRLAHLKKGLKSEKDIEFFELDEKIKAITFVLNSANFEESKLRDALGIKRDYGFFKKNMPKSYNNVFCGSRAYSQVQCA